MIHFKNVNKQYNSNVGLKNVDLHIRKGDFVFVVGPSGAGKSTFIRLIMKEINADSGTIEVMDKDVVNLKSFELPLYRRKIGMIYQDFRLLPKKTVYENVAFAMEIIHKSKRQIKKQVPLALELMGISSKANRFPSELSAGEQQRVAIARAIVNKPDILIADEPTGNLDPDTAWEIMRLLEQINKNGTTIVMVTHAKDIVDRMQKRVIVIESGSIVADEVGKYLTPRDTMALKMEDIQQAQLEYEKSHKQKTKKDVFEENNEKKDIDKEKKKKNNHHIKSHATVEASGEKIKDNDLEMAAYSRKSRSNRNNKNEGIANKKVASLDTKSLHEQMQEHGFVGRSSRKNRKNKQKNKGSIGGNDNE